MATCLPVVPRLRQAPRMLTLGWWTRTFNHWPRPYFPGPASCLGTRVTGVAEVLQTAQDKLRPTNYPLINDRHAAWFPSLLVLLTAWVA